MRKEKSIQNVTIIVLAVAILVMSVGFALYSSQLTINGTATFKKSMWNVEFDTSSYSETANSTITVDQTDTDVFQFGNTSLVYDVTLTAPGEVYEFTVDVYNGGTIDAELSGVTLSKSVASGNVGAYVGYTVYYTYTDSNSVEHTNTYTATTSGLAIPLPADTSATVTVRVEYVAPNDPAALPTSADVPVTFGLTLDYVDALT